MSKKSTIKPTEKYKPSKEVQKQKDTELRPITSLFAGHKESLGDGSKKYRGLETGIKELDELSQGLDGFVLLAARAGTGKTTLAMQLALGVIMSRIKENAKRREEGLEELPPIPVLIYSFEMSKYSLLTNLLQVSAVMAGHKDCLTRNDIDLEGRDPEQTGYKVEALQNAYEFLGHENIGQYIHIKDSSDIRDRANPNQRIHILDGNDIPNGERVIERDIIDIRNMYKLNNDKSEGKQDDILVIIDSAQDLVDSTNANTTSAEKEVAEKLEFLQRETGCTLLVTSQKNKGSARSNDSYGDVMGSAAWLHKPNTVWMLNSLRESVEKNSQSMKKNEYSTAKRSLKKIDEYTKQTGLRQLILHQEKGRFTGADSDVTLLHHGWYGYFEAKVDDNFMALLPGDDD